MDEMAGRAGSGSTQSGNNDSQRLVLCLDGTWNQQDSGTSVYNLSNLVVDDELRSERFCRQRVFYQAGVGTNALDRGTGGAFGIGLSKNVREAYDWLVENYRDGDEIYLFGFSRGAFTARSLVGLISKCGLLRRGAPISPDELWHGYQILGRHEQARSKIKPSLNWWERIRGRPKMPFRQIEVLRPQEPWQTKPIADAPQEPANRAERLLLEWSRRPPIHCVGVFETVGALGVGALAIPWVRDVTAQFHDARLTTLVINGFHALAIDERRASFAHIPWYRELTSPAPPDQTEEGGKLEQRWFTGAHSDVGGGYDDDVLSQRSLAWMIQETKALGLVYRAITTPPDPDPATPPPIQTCIPLVAPVPAPQPDLADQPPALHDSYAEFAAGIWKNFIRAKPAYRKMAPPAELQGGKAMRTINETLDPSVRDLVKKDPAYRPPNLWSYFEDHPPNPMGAAPPHRYSEPRWQWWAWLVAWLLLIAGTGWTVGGRLGGWLGALGFGTPVQAWPWRWLALAAPAIALLLDWRASALNHRNALAPYGFVDGRLKRADEDAAGKPKGLAAERRLAWVNVYLFFRLGATFAALAGVVILVCLLLGPWLLLDFPACCIRIQRCLIGIQPCLIWIFVLDLLWIYLQTTLAYNGGPMTDAGLGSIYKLQQAKTPAAVEACLASWADKKHLPADSTLVDGRRLLMPVVQGLWRDMLAFIPVYSGIFFVGSWLALSLGRALVHGRGLPPASVVGLLDPHLWLPVLAGVVLCALADYLEDWGELQYVRTFPGLPTKGLVWRTYAATVVKMALFTVGFLLTALATIALALGTLVSAAAQILSWFLVQFGHDPIALPFCCNRPVGTLGVAASLLALLLVLVQVRTWRSATKE